ncbi:MAG TPA: type II toxin-antitoxin system HicB family antitoxin [Sumerlaeia bacterium]|nr:type II toxin-antitoxin system HicB family antitoxin [Sumerlaeia bacterium]
MKTSVIVEKDEAGYFAYCPQLKGCHTQGETLEEALQNIRECVDLYLETLDVEEKQALLSKEILSTFIEV